MRKKKLFVFLVFMIVFIGVARLWFIPWCYDKELHSLPDHTKLIEMVTEVPWFRGYAERYGAFKGCAVDDCHMTRCQGKRTPDALAFLAEAHSPRVFLPKAPGQTWFYITWESPVTVGELNGQFTPDLYSKFDLAMTYKDGSDIYMPYSTVVKLENPPKRNLTAVMMQKRRLAAQVSSHCECQSRRADYIRLMQQYVSVDVYGKCGSRSCSSNCFALINKEYKFYLSFENSLCAGYITEKFFSIYDMDVVPVARGYTDYSKLFPPKTFIDTRDFPTVKALAEYLEYLDKNDTAYMEYLEAKATYRSTYAMPDIRDNFMKEKFCDLCYHMHTKVPLKRRQRDFRTWWSKETSCVEPRDIV